MERFRVLLPVVCFVLAVSFRTANADESKSAPSTIQTQSATQTSAPSVSDDAQHPALQHRNPRYQLGKDDVLDLTFPLTPEFNQTVTVQPDGYITLRNAGDVHVEGQTIPDVTKAIRVAYARVLHDPVINVDLKDFEKPSFIAGGKVGRPGRYELRGDTTITQAVAIAGGFTEESKHSEVWLFRRVSNEWAEVHRLNVKQMLRSGDLREDLHLRPGDMLYVPQNSFSKIKRFIPVATMSSYFSPVP